MLLSLGSSIQAATYNAGDATQLIAILQGSVLSDGDTIVLTGTDYDLSTLSNTLAINKQITIKSGTNAILKTSTAKDFPWLGANSPVRFENVTFQFQRADSQLNYATFHDVIGGGLVNNGQNLVFDGATFQGNSILAKATSNGNTPGGFVRGAGLAQQGGTIVFNGETRFLDNSINLTETATSIGSSVYKNVAGSGGAAVYLDSGEMFFNGETLFQGNRLSLEYRLNVDTSGESSYLVPASPAAAFYNNKGTVHFNDKASFLGNTTTITLTAFGTPLKLEPMGAALGNTTGTINFYKEALFENNVTKSDDQTLSAWGGPSAILMNGGNTPGTINFYDKVRFFRNSAEDIDSPFGVTVGVAGGRLNFYGETVFENNEYRSPSSTADGGAICIEGRYGRYDSEVNIYSSAYFLNNSVAQGYFGHGGAVAINGAGAAFNIRLSHPGDEVVFRGNTDVVGANAIFIEYSGNMNLEHVMGTDVYFYDPVSTFSTNSGGATISQTKCGTTHFINNTSEYLGDTNVNKGFFQFENATYGNTGSGRFSIGSQGTVSGFGTNELKARAIDISGWLRPGYDVTKGIVSYHAGSKLELNNGTGTTTFRPGSVYKPLLFADATASLATHGSGYLLVASGAVIDLGFRPGDYSNASGYTVNTLTGFDTVRKAGFIDADYNSGTGGITFNGLKSDFFAANGQTKNQRGVGGALDQLVMNPNVNDTMWDVLTELSILVENGDPRANKYYDQLSGAQRANTVSVALMTPKNLAFNHIGNGVRYNGQRYTSQDEMIIRGNNGGRISGYGISSQNLWFQPYYRSMQIGSDGNCGGYDVDQSGFFVGTDKALTRTLYGGVYFGYSEPKLNGNDFRSRIYDYSMGGLIGSKLRNGWDWKAWSTLGYQHYSMNRGGLDPSDLMQNCQPCIPLNYEQEFYTGRTHGMTFSTGFEIGKILRPRPGQFEWLRYRPFIGFDFEHAFQNGFNEEGESLNYALSYLDENYDRTQFHMGASALITTRFIELNGRMMYTCLLGGDAAPSSGARFLGTSGSFVVDGVNLGYHALDLGMDGTIYLNQKRSRFVTGTYEASLGRRGVAQTAALTYTQMY